MNCKNCGAMILDNDEFCQMCGTRLTPVVMTPQAPVSNGTAGNGKFILIGILLILSVVLLPMYNRGLIMGDLLPNDQSVWFTEAMEMFFEDTDSIKYYVVVFNLAGIVGGVLYLLGALANSRGFCGFSAFAGGGVMLFFLINFISENDVEDVFSLDDTAICIGFWVTLILFVIGFFQACSSKNR